MITKQNLVDLGYNKKQDRIIQKLVSEDFRFNEPGEREYLVNLHNGIVNIEFGAKNGYKNISITELADFIKWHDSYEE